MDWAMTTTRRDEKHFTLQWRHNGCDSVSNHQPNDCLLNRLFRHRSKKTSKLRVTGLCAGNSPGTGELPAQMASNADFFSIWWRHHVLGFGVAYIRDLTECGPLWHSLILYVNNIVVFPAVTSKVNEAIYKLITWCDDNLIYIGRFPQM